MIPITTLRGRHVALFGLGGSGMTTAKALMAGGVRVDAWDDNEGRVEAALDDGIDCLDLRDADFERYAALVLAPGVPLTHPEPHWTVKMAEAAGVEVIGDVELFMREREAVCPEAAFVAITGTNGKSTTTALTAHILKQAGMDVQMGGNIGRPILDLDPLTEDRVYVIECSSYQIDLAPSLAPDVGVMLNLSPDHLDRHGSMENYASIKERLVRASRLAVVGVDDDTSSAMADRLEAAEVQVERISCKGAIAKGDGIFADGPQLFESFDGEQTELLSIQGHMSLRGAHNAQNTAAASAVALALGLSPEELAEGIASFPGLEHRLQPVATAGRVVFVNDSKGTNAEATAHALASFDRIYWIAGGRAKTGGITSLESYFPRIAKAYLIGEASQDFAQTLSGKAQVEECGDLETAVAAAAKDAATSDADECVVLLSPACASFDQFPSFEVRGQRFAELAAVAAANLTEPGGH
ncbi:UDP-N-acetylmuramoyl-L-alanine--D-glutamate ligase [Pseudovibrio sp. SPO723]|uniref:UDP-N-acetylmuramoyl-L-alanine--D-glutamate ligase n=1 Tax=Nesiotobacter zosterae TaxID=392721 RepID=UPI0029C19743|nr:UDP-N-acetylmuramoyl-L-alanine--D-glutamate ligase [Pseudovibrio sp. SPO723]MDX5594033.1 UDP-N-acetylmuramoyl-L-alanine--D-glutamate ligase [Pseudovibrio sp. SPO723]